MSILLKRCECDFKLGQENWRRLGHPMKTSFKSDERHLCWSHNDFYSDLFIYVGIVVVYDRYRQHIYLYIGYIFNLKHTKNYN